MNKDNVEPQKTFKVNEYITLKLENDKTNICINGKLLHQCRYLLFVNPQLNKAQKNITSIDDIEDIVAGEEEEITDLKKLGITPEQDFWAHCSNLQTSYEHNYDTRLLRSNLSFPMLRALVKAGVKLAKKVFKLEVAERFIASTPWLQDILIEEGYLDDFTGEEINDLYREILGKEYDAILEIEAIIGEKIPNVPTLGGTNFRIENRHIYKLFISGCSLLEFPEKILTLKNLRELKIKNCGLKSLPEGIGELKRLEVLDLSNNCLERLP
ncbi:MAG: leucine-rich repeat domain-containing protein [Candidatus Helarchaeota archaeon]